MSILVMKFGGTSVANIDRIHREISKTLDAFGRGKLCASLRRKKPVALDCFMTRAQFLLIWNVFLVFRSKFNIEPGNFSDKLRRERL